MISTNIPVPGSAGATCRTCHMCGGAFSKASLPGHQRGCIRKSLGVNQLTRTMATLSAGSVSLFPCTSCMRKIPQPKLAAHLRTCKGVQSSHEHEHEHETASDLFTHQGPDGYGQSLRGINSQPTAATSAPVLRTMRKPSGMQAGSHGDVFGDYDYAADAPSLLRSATRPAPISPQRSINGQSSLPMPINPSSLAAAYNHHARGSETIAVAAESSMHVASIPSSPYHGDASAPASTAVGRTPSATSSSASSAGAVRTPGGGMRVVPKRNLREIPPSSTLSRMPEDDHAHGSSVPSTPGNPQSHGYAIANPFAASNARPPSSVTAMAGSKTPQQQHHQQHQQQALSRQNSGHINAQLSAPNKAAPPGSGRPAPHAGNTAPQNAKPQQQANPPSASSRPRSSAATPTHVPAVQPQKPRPKPAAQPVQQSFDDMPIRSNPAVSATTNIDDIPIRPRQRQEPNADAHGNDTQDDPEAHIPSEYPIDEALDEGMGDEYATSGGPLIPCYICGRKFMQERLDKHTDACAKASKARKVFDASKARAKGTDIEKYTGKGPREGRSDGASAGPAKPPKKNNWRIKHEAAGPEDGAPVIDPNPDYVTCPSCNRRFNEDSGARHIPLCKERVSHSTARKAQPAAPFSGRGGAGRGRSNGHGHHGAPAAPVETKEDMLKRRTAYKPPAPKTLGKPTSRK
ncbi:hypothetical protein BC831DRAFT_469845 [Entophlyctis helioformis]|nr:hypothetical protein BC831DRAFT_469845 [Entophlyctis helioformis]